MFSLPAAFLPTYLAGIEACSHARWSMRCHSMSSHFDLRWFLFGEARTCALALAITIVVGSLAALALGHRSRLGVPIPAVVLAIVAAVALPWCALLLLVTL